MGGCRAPVSDEALLEYWFDRTSGAETERIEDHLIGCAECSARLSGLVEISAGLSALAREGRLSGVIPRSILNDLQRSGVRVRLYTLAPGETVACAAFPGDDLLAATFSADLSGVEAISFSTRGSGGTLISDLEDVPVVPSEGGIVWVLPGSVVRQLPSTQVRITIKSAGEARRVLGEYVLDHSSLDLDG